MSQEVYSMSIFLVVYSHSCLVARSRVESGECPHSTNASGRPMNLVASKLESK
jgi:hypothetical protein